jgi:hypothetical protein
MPHADWVIIAALTVVIALAVRYYRRHSGQPPR